MQVVIRLFVALICLAGVLSSAAHAGGGHGVQFRQDFSSSYSAPVQQFSAPVQQFSLPAQVQYVQPVQRVQLPTRVQFVQPVQDVVVESQSSYCTGSVQQFSAPVQQFRLPAQQQGGGFFKQKLKTRSGSRGFFRR